jgi:hypothetical protein
MAHIKISSTLRYFYLMVTIWSFVALVRTLSADTDFIKGLTFEVTVERGAPAPAIILCPGAISNCISEAPALAT